jgi:aminoglycoside phosphotransferase (APT) family kinase protein
MTASTWPVTSAAVAHDAPDPAGLARVIERFVEGPVEVDGLRRFSGGASRETWAVDAIDVGGRIHRLVLRRDPVTQTSAENRATEYALLAAADAGGVPVPRVRALLADDDGLGAGFLMDRVDGESIPAPHPARRRVRRRPSAADRAGRRDRGAYTRGRSRWAARLPVVGARQQIEQQRALLDAFDEPHPALELGLRWLERHAPADERNAALVHGDFRNGNFIVGPDGIRAVLDWELAHLGDPFEDLGWLCVKSWRFGNADQIAGGFGPLDELLDAYMRAGGAPVDEDVVRFWVVLGTVKWGVICAGQALAFVNGILRNVEMAALGRRVAEMEWDLLDLLDGGW